MSHNSDTSHYYEGVLLRFQLEAHLASLCEQGTFKTRTLMAMGCCRRARSAESGDDKTNGAASGAKNGLVPRSQRKYERECVRSHP